MFGMILANKAALSPEDAATYDAFYCGVCRSLGDGNGAWCRAALSWDMTFLALFLEGLAPRGGRDDARRCLLHQGEKTAAHTSVFTDYAAQMNLALAYYKCLDDWQDEGRLRGLGGSKLLTGRVRRIADRRPRQWQALQRGIGEIAALESAQERSPDVPAAAFGRIMGEIFVMDGEDANADGLRRFGNALGRFIYILDAVLDLKEDLINERYNPLTALVAADPEDLLDLMLSDCVAAYRALPPNRYDSIVENVLYSGVWMRYMAQKDKDEKKKDESEENHESKSL